MDLNYNSCSKHVVFFQLLKSVHLEGFFSREVSIILLFVIPPQCKEAAFLFSWRPSTKPVFIPNWEQKRQVFKISPGAKLGEEKETYQWTMHFEPAEAFHFNNRTNVSFSFDRLTTSNSNSGVQEMKIFYVKMKKLIKSINLSHIKALVIHLPSKSTQANESYSVSMTVPYFQEKLFSQNLIDQFSALLRFHWCWPSCVWME